MGRTLLNAWIEEENCEVMPARFQHSGNCADIISPPCWRDGAETGVLKDPVEPTLPFLGQGKEIPLFVDLGPCTRKIPCKPECCLREVESRDLGSFRRNRADIMSVTASRYENMTGDGMACQEVGEGRCGTTLVPRGIPGDITRFPIHGISDGIGHRITGGSRRFRVRCRAGICVHAP